MKDAEFEEHSDAEETYNLQHSGDHLLTEWLIDPSGGKIRRVKRSINGDTLVRDRRDHPFCRLLSSLLL